MKKKKKNPACVYFVVVFLARWLEEKEAGVFCLSHSLASSLPPRHPFAHDDALKARRG